MPAAIVSAAGKVTRLGGRSGPDETVAVADVQDPPKLARLLTRMLASLAFLARQRRVRYIDFEDIAVGTGGALTQPLAHRFNGRVRWYVIEWTSPGTLLGVTVYMPMLVTDPSSDANNLVLSSRVQGTATIRVEAAQ